MGSAAKCKVIYDRFFFSLQSLYSGAPSYHTAYRRKWAAGISRRQPQCALLAFALSSIGAQCLLSSGYLEEHVNQIMEAWILVVHLKLCMTFCAPPQSHR